MDSKKTNLTNNGKQKVMEGNDFPGPEETRYIRDTS